MTLEEEVVALTPILANAPNDWRCKVLGLITRIPEGCLMSYGELANAANIEYGLLPSERKYLSSERLALVRRAEWVDVS